MNARYPALMIMSCLALSHALLAPSGLSLAADVSGGPQQLVQTPDQSQQQFQQQPPQQYPGQQTQGVQQPPEQVVPPQTQFPPNQSMPGWQPMAPPGQMMTGQSACTVKVSSDRTVISLIEAGSQQARDHVSINPDRVRKVVTSPDGNWSLVMFKVRGENSYGAIPVDLVKCEAQETVDIPAVTDNAQFEGDAVTLTYPDGTMKRFSLQAR